jgi:hypothetical protein
MALFDFDLFQDPASVPTPELVAKKFNPLSTIPQPRSVVQVRQRVDWRREGALGGVQDFPQSICLQEVWSNEIPAALQFCETCVRTPRL